MERSAADRSSRGRHGLPAVGCGRKGRAGGAGNPRRVPSPRRRRAQRTGDAGAMARTCLSPLGFEWPVSQAVAGTFMDVLIHTWDLARATGQDGKLDPNLVEACSAMFLPDMPDRGRAAGIVGPPSMSARTPHHRIACWRPWVGERDRSRGRRRHSGARTPRPTRDAAAGMGRRAASERTRRRCRSVQICGEPAPQTSARRRPVDVRIDAPGASIERISSGLPRSPVLDDFWAPPLEPAQSRSRSKGEKTGRHARSS